MPVYDYYCEANGRTVEVSHDLDHRLKYWAEVCYVAQESLGDTDPLAPVTRVMTTAPGISVQPFNSELRNLGFTKLVRRDVGVLENVTALDEEKRYVIHGDASSMPRFDKKVGD